MTLRILALAALAATAALAIRDALSGTGLAALGEVWFSLAPGSLNLAQAVIQRYISPAVWDPGIIWVLAQPAVAITGAIAAGLVGLVLVRRGR